MICWYKMTLKHCSLFNDCTALLIVSEDMVGFITHPISLIKLVLADTDPPQIGYHYIKWVTMGKLPFEPENISSSQLQQLHRGLDLCTLCF